jgi:hypothetical protein
MFSEKKIRKSPLCICKRSDHVIYLFALTNIDHQRKNMKKTLLLTMLFCALCCCGKTLRIDISGLPEYVNIKSSLDQTIQSSKVNAGTLQKTVLLPMCNAYKKFELEFTAPQATVIGIALRSTSEEVILVDDFSAKGFVLKNGGFETLSKKKTFAVWRGSSANMVSDPKLVHSGKYCGKVTYSSRINLKGIKIPGGQRSLPADFTAVKNLPPLRQS